MTLTGNSIENGKLVAHKKTKKEKNTLTSEHAIWRVTGKTENLTSEKRALYSCARPKHPYQPGHKPRIPGVPA